MRPSFSGGQCCEGLDFLNCYYCYLCNTRICFCIHLFCNAEPSFSCILLCISNGMYVRTADCCGVFVMPDITRNGVCYAIEDSPFYEEVDGYRFYFSSETHRSKFFEKARIRQNWLTDSLSRRFHFHLDASLVAIFQLYSQVESRGFYVVSERGEEFRCLEQLRLRVVM